MEPSCSRQPLGLFSQSLSGAIRTSHIILLFWKIEISIFFGALEVQEFNKLLCRAVGFHFKIDFEKQFDLIASVNFYVLTKDCYIEFN